MNIYTVAELISLGASTFFMLRGGPAHWFLGLTILIELYRHAKP